MIYNFNVWGKIFKNVHTADDAYSSGVLQIVSGWCNQPAAAVAQQLAKPCGIVPKASISATNARILHEFDKPCAKGTFVYSWHLNNRYGNC